MIALVEIFIAVIMIPPSLVTVGDTKEDVLMNAKI